MPLRRETMIKLREDQLQELDGEQQPPVAIDPRTGQEYLLIKREVYHLVSGMNRGDVVEVDWPFTDLTGTKPRPAIVVQADFLNGLIDDTIYVKIQSKSYGIPGTEVEIDPAVETLSGLSKLCYASCKDILTREQSLILRAIGVVSSSVMQQIENCLKQVLKIP
jgi:mRNA interferase MazF